MYKWVLPGICIGAFLSGSAHGDLKVLFKFDSSGIQAHRVVEIAGSTGNYPTSVPELPLSPSENLVIMSWVDADGQLLAVTQVSDPRIASSPEHMNPSSVSRVGLLEGAWVNNGPDGTETVIIEFPENAALGLATEIWSVSLRQDK